MAEEELRGIKSSGSERSGRSRIGAEKKEMPSISLGNRDAVCSAPALH